MYFLLIFKLQHKKKIIKNGNIRLKMNEDQILQKNKHVYILIFTIAQ